MKIYKPPAWLMSCWQVQKSFNAFDRLASCFEFATCFNLESYFSFDSQCNSRVNDDADSNGSVKDDQRYHQGSMHGSKARFIENILIKMVVVIGLLITIPCSFTLVEAKTTSHRLLSGTLNTCVAQSAFASDTIRSQQCSSIKDELNCVRESNCKAPLTARQLIQKKLNCGDDNNILEAGPKVESITLDECEIKCRGLKGCVWFSQNPSTGNCVFRKHGCENTQSGSGAYVNSHSYRPTGYVPEGCAAQLTHKCQICPKGKTCVNTDMEQIYTKYEDQDISGSDITSITPISETDCLLKCNQDQNCKSVAYIISDERCWLKTINFKDLALTVRVGVNIFEKVYPIDCPTSDTEVGKTGEHAQFILKYENSYCGEQAGGIWDQMILEGSQPSPFLCSQLCKAHDDCIEFSWGKATTALNYCRLYKSPCTQSGLDEKWDHYYFVGNRQQSTIAPLTTYSLIKENWQCKDNASYKLGENDIGLTLEECNTKCVEQEGCEWFTHNPSTGECAKKKYGCELLHGSANGINSYRPTGFVPMGYRNCPAPLTELTKLADVGYICGDDGMIKTSDQSTVGSLEECHQKCLQENCALIFFNPSGMTCSLRKEGCEQTSKKSGTSELYRPKGYVPPGCKLCSWNNPYTPFKEHHACAGGIRAPNFFMKHGRVILNFDDKVIDGITFDACQSQCLNEQSFNCASADYNIEIKRCYLSKAKEGDPGVTMLNVSINKAIYSERITYDARSCDLACTNLETQNCVMFQVGREEGPKKGECWLLTTVCANPLKNVDYDLYTASPKTYPETTKGKCTHLQSLSPLATYRDKCSTITVSEECHQTKSILQKFGTQHIADAETKRISINTGPYTVEQCDVKCQWTPGCLGFQIGVAGSGYIGRCDLLKTTDVTFTAEYPNWDVYDSPMDCNEQLSGTKDAGYRGCQSKTQSGRTCQAWNSQTPQTHTKSLLYSNGLQGTHNYCRNPDGERTIWCYTTDPNKRWEYCSPLQTCDDPLHEMKLFQENKKCGDDGALNLEVYEHVESVEQCHSYCRGNPECVLFAINSGGPSKNCVLKKHGCERTMATQNGVNLYRPAGYISPDCQPCTWTPSYQVKYRFGGCQQYATLVYAVFNGPFTAEQCFQKCLTDERRQCKEFGISTYYDLAEAGCNLMSGECTKGNNVKWNQYSVTDLVFPSIEREVCTHKQGISHDKEKRDICSSLSDSVSCKKWEYCRWNSDWVLKKEKHNCQNIKTVDEVASPEACNQLCKDELTCSQFAYGRSDGTSPKKCNLNNDACTEKYDINYDYYLSTPKVPPSTELNVCTHTEANSAEKTIRETCSAITLKSQCLQNTACQFTPGWALRSQKTGCGPMWATVQLDKFIDRAYTIDECDQFCILNKQCVDFAIGILAGNKGFCWLYKAGCSFPSADHTDSYISSVKVNPSRTAEVCTHTQANSADKEKRDHCSSITEKITCQIDKDCDWTKPYGIQFENGRCLEENDLKIGDTLTGKTEKTCDDACIMEKECVSFALGKDTNAGQCMLFKGTCSEQQDTTFEVFTSSKKVNPSEKPEFCTHTQKWSAQKTLREYCPTVKDQTTCELLKTSTDQLMKFEGLRINDENTKILTGVAIADCLPLCIQETSFKCKSIDYMTSQQFCNLSDKSMDDDVVVVSIAGTDHYHRSDESCQWTKNYQVGEELACSNLNDFSLESLSSKTKQTCKQACIEKLECFDFQLGKTGTSEAGKCTLLKPLCPMQVDLNYDFYSTRWVEFPSRKASVCTHMPHFSDSQTVIDVCKALSDQTSCEANSKCQFTPTYGVLHENSYCKEGEKYRINDIYYGQTLETCNLNCVKENECIEFKFQRSTSKCMLFKGSCTPILRLDNTEDIWTPSPKIYPTSTFSSCTHVLLKSHQPTVIEKCKALTTSATCLSHPTKTFPKLVKKRAHCTEADYNMFILKTIEDSTVDSCKTLCDNTQGCKFFSIGRLIGADYYNRCHLYSSECKYTTTHQLDHYVITPECPPPLNYPELIKRDTTCSTDDQKIWSGLALNVLDCDLKCQLYADCTWFVFKREGTLYCRLYRECDTIANELLFDSYRPTGYIPPDCECQYPKYKKIAEQMTCSNLSTIQLGTTSYQSPEMCNDLCTLHRSRSCIGFSFRNFKSTSYGRCILLKAPCVQDSYTYYDQYEAASKVYPSLQKSVCTHKWENTVDDTKIKTCAAITDKTQCTSNLDCDWTPPFGIKHEKSGCLEPEHQIGDILSDQVYTSESCDKACIADEYCIEFAIGRLYEENEGKCILFKGLCTKKDDGTMDLYTSSEKINSSKAASVCTHKQVHSANQELRDKCQSIQEEELCTQDTDCFFTPKYGIKFEKGTCDKAELELKIENPLELYTEETCDLACVHHGHCVNFAIGKIYEEDKGKCKLFASGCEQQESTSFDFYTSQSKNEYCLERVTKVESSLKTNSIQQLHVYTTNLSLFKIILDPSEGQQSTIIINEFLDYKTDFLPCQVYVPRLCSDEKCISDSQDTTFSITVQEKPVVEPNAITGIPKLGLDIDLSKSLSSYVYIAVYDDPKFEQHFGVAKGLVIVCGEEKVVLQRQEPIEYHKYALPTNEKENGALLDLFSVDIQASKQTLGDCPIQKFILCKDKLCATELETHPNMVITDSKFEFDSKVPLVKETLYIGAMTSVGKPSLATKEFNLIVCGYEQISTTEESEIILTQKLEEGKITIDLKTKFKSSEEQDCPIDSFSLYEDAAGAQPSKSIQTKIDEEFNLVINPSSSAQNLVFYAVAESKALVRQSMKLDITFTKDETSALPFVAVNSAPTIEGLISDISVEVTFLEQSSTYLDPSVYEYVSPVAADADGDEVAITFTGSEGKPYVSIEVAAEQPQFTLRIDRSLITSDDAGSFDLEVKLSDSTDEQVYSIPITIGYTFVPKPAESTTQQQDSSTQQQERQVAPAKVDFAPSTFAPSAPILELPPDEELPDLDNLSPEEEKKLDEKVDKAMEALGDALGGDFGDEDEGGADEEGEEADVDKEDGEEAEQEEAETEDTEPEEGASNSTSSEQESSADESTNESANSTSEATNKTEGAGQSNSSTSSGSSQQPSGASKASQSSSSAAQKSQTSQTKSAPVRKFTPTYKTQQSKPIIRPIIQKPEYKPRPPGAKSQGWFKTNVKKFKQKLKKFGGDFMKYVAKMKPPGVPEAKPSDIPYMGCYIKSIDQLGKVVLQFNITLIPELIYTEDLKRVLRFVITPEDDGSDGMDPNSEKYKFDWEVTGFDKKLSTIDFQLNFENADGISMGEQEDTIDVVVLDRRFFQPKINRRMLSKRQMHEEVVTPDRVPLNTNVKLIRQMPNDEASHKLKERAEHANGAGSFLTVLIFIVQSYMMGVFKKLIGTLLALQIVVHLGLLNVKMPGAVTCFNSTIKGVTYFNVMNFLATLNEWVLPFNHQEQSKMREQHMSVPLRGLGFTHMNCILTLKNAGQMLFLNCCLVVIFLFYFLRYKLLGARDDKKTQKTMADNLFFSPFLGMSFRLFIPMLISSYLNLKYQLHNKNNFFGDMLSDYYAMFILLLVAGFFPITMLYVALVPVGWLYRTDFKKKWSFLYTSIKTETFMQRTYYFMFILRRAALVFTGMMLFNYPSIQVQITMGCNILLLIWSVTARAYKNPFLNKMEMNTEMFMAVITFHLLCFTDFIPEKGGGLQVRIQMGYSFIFWVCMLVTINLFFVFKEMGRLFKYKLIKRYRMFLLKHRPEAFKDDLIQRNARYKDVIQETYLNDLKISMTKNQNKAAGNSKSLKSKQNNKDKRKKFKENKNILGLTRQQTIQKVFALSSRGMHDRDSSIGTDESLSSQSEDAIDDIYKEGAEPKKVQKSSEQSTRVIKVNCKATDAISDRELRMPQSNTRRQARKRARQTLKHSVIKEEDESSCCSDSSVESVMTSNKIILASHPKSTGRRRIPPSTQDIYRASEQEIKRTDLAATKMFEEMEDLEKQADFDNRNKRLEASIQNNNALIASLIRVANME